MILVATLGMSWPIIPEVYGLLAPARYDLYRHQPQALAQVHNLSEPDAVWIITTADTRHQERVTDWWTSIGKPVPLEWFIADTGDGSAQAAVELIRELILRVVLKAGSDAVLCLAGGRKTMSADLQRAGMAFGCQAMLHVLPPEGKETEDRLNKHDWATPLPADLLIQAVLVGKASPRDLLVLAPAITTAAYPVIPGIFAPPDKWLWSDLNEREADGSRLLANFHTKLSENEAHENWRSLYRLPPGVIQRLRGTPITSAQRPWLVALPKADLHCHLGGILDLDEQIQVGKAVWNEVAPADRAQAETDAAHWLTASDKTGKERWPFNEDPPRRARAAAAVLSQTPKQHVAEALWPPGLRLALTRNHPWGFRAYEHPGSLVGSTILQTPAATWATAQAIRKRCRRDGLAYLELRCSPQKYYPDFLRDLHEALNHDVNQDDPIIRVIVIADRTNANTIRDTVQLALDARQQLAGFVVGLDMAGDEKHGDPQSLSPAFQRAFEECLPITIHAGEGQPADNIWKSAYHLHADRIGHGLTLANVPELARRFRDRRIALELCPTSNREVVGFHDPDHPGCAAPYPLRALMDLGVPLTLCTDNPGISRTTLADEYLAAGRMAGQSGLSCWEALALIKQAFLHAFLPAAERERLLKQIDAKILTHCEKL